MEKNEFGVAYVTPSEKVLAAAKQWCKEQKTFNWRYGFDSFIESSFNPGHLPVYYPEIAILKVVVFWMDHSRPVPHSVKVFSPLFLAVDYNEKNEPFIHDAIYHPSGKAFKTRWESRAGRHVSLPIPEGRYMVNTMHSPYGECDVTIIYGRRDSLYLGEPAPAETLVPEGYIKMEFLYEASNNGRLGYPGDYLEWVGRDTPLLFTEE